MDLIIYFIAYVLIGLLASVISLFAAKLYLKKKTGEELSGAYYGDQVFHLDFTERFGPMIEALFEITSLLFQLVLSPLKLLMLEPKEFLKSVVLVVFGPITIPVGIYLFVVSQSPTPKGAGL
jgi:hypothetical protein